MNIAPERQQFITQQPLHEVIATLVDYLKSHNLDAGSGLADAVLTVYPDNIAVLRAAARLKFAASKPQEAKGHLEHAYALQPGNPVIAASLARSEVTHGNMDRARDILTSVEAHLSHSLLAMEMARDVYAELGEAEKAERLATMALNKSTRTSVAVTSVRKILVQMEAHIAKDEYAEVIDLAENALSSIPDNIPLLNMAGYASYCLGETQRSYHFLEKAVTIQPKNPLVAARFAQTAHALGHTAQAEAALNTALTFIPISSKATAAARDYLNAAGRFVEADVLAAKHNATIPAGATMVPNTTDGGRNQ